MLGWRKLLFSIKERVLLKLIELIGLCMNIVSFFPKIHHPIYMSISTNHHLNRYLMPYFSLMFQFVWRFFLVKSVKKKINFFNLYENIYNYYVDTNFFWKNLFILKFCIQLNTCFHTKESTIIYISGMHRVLVYCIVTIWLLKIVWVWDSSGSNLFHVQNKCLNSLIYSKCMDHDTPW